MDHCAWHAVSMTSRSKGQCASMKSKKSQNAHRCSTGNNALPASWFFFLGMPSTLNPSIPHPESIVSGRTGGIEVGGVQRAVLSPLETRLRIFRIVFIGWPTLERKMP